MKPSRPKSTMIAEQAAALATDSTALGLALVAEGGDLLWANPSFKRLAATLGISPAELANPIHDKKGKSVCNSKGQTWQLLWRQMPDSLLLVEAVPQQLTGKSLSPAEGELDLLTGVLNRQGLEQELERWFDAAIAKPFALVFLDLDDFKTINDEQGHLAGDERLRQVGARLRGAVRAGDVVGRFGGDEFIILVSGITKDADLKPVCKRLSRVGDCKENQVDVSLGSAFSAEGYENPQAMLHAADRRMYAAKRAKNS